MHKNIFIGNRGFSYLIMTVCFCILIPISAYGTDKLIVMGSDHTTKFVVTDTGQVGIGTDIPQQDLDIVAPNDGFVLLSNTTADATLKAGRMVVRHYLNSQQPLYVFGAASVANNNYVAFGGGYTGANAATQVDFYTAQNTTTAMGYPRITIKGNGYIGVGTQTPAYPLHMASGAGCTAGGVWTNASSREYKENISELGTEEALLALNRLDPVKFNYKADKYEKHDGFIAEDDPDLVVSKDRKGLSTMDIVAVLTRVVKEQQKTIDRLTEKINRMEKQIK